MNHAPLLASLVLVAVTVACHDSSSSSSNPSGSGVSVTNLGVSARELVGEGNLFVASVSEIDEGVDLNGDGDTLDLVAHVLDVRSGRLANTGLATRPAGPSPSDVVPPALPQVTRSLAVFVVSEASQGAADLNGDGDANDFVLHVYDTVAEVARNVGYAVVVYGRSGLAVTEDCVAFVVTEFGQGGEDMNGDGDAGDSILHVLDLDTSIVIGILTALGSTDVAIEGPFVAYLEAEGPLSGDVNDDGDQDDPAVLQVYDTRSGSFTNTRLATSGPAGLFAGGAWLFPVRESEQGDRDLNGDGDAVDSVLHTYDPAAGVARSLGIASVSPYSTVSSGELFAAAVLETQMGEDLNGDGDELDHVAFLIDPTTGSVTNTDLAIPSSNAASFLLDDLAVGVQESAQGGQDLNGDGDAFDLVPHVVDLATGASRNLGVEGLSFTTSERFLLIQRIELEAGVDFNGDGDLDDVMFFSWDSRTGALDGTGTSTAGLIDLETSTLLHVVADFFEGDLNADGDLDDTTAVGVDLVSGRRVDLRLSPSSGRLVSEDTALLLVAEARQEEDLNGDGDTDDSVLFRVELFR